MKICIFCGANASHDPAVSAVVATLMESFAREGIGLVYGGAGIGIMGALADRLLERGGQVTGVIPEALMTKEIAHADLTELHVVKNMHDRKKLMYDLSDAFLILPGGMGTMDELFEILTWRQLGFHRKPIALLNVNGYYDHLLAFLDHAVAEGLVRASDRELLFSAADWNDILNHFREHRP